MNIRKKWLLTLSRTDSDKVVKVSLSQRTVVFLFTVLLIVITLIVLSVLYVNSHREDIDKISFLKQENRKLQTHIGELSAVMDSVQTDIEHMKALEDSLRSDENLQELYDSIKENR